MVLVAEDDAGDVMTGRWWQQQRRLGYGLCRMPYADGGTQICLRSATCQFTAYSA